MGGNCDPYDYRAAGAPSTDNVEHWLLQNATRRALHVPAAAPAWGAESDAVEKGLLLDLNAPTSLPLWPAMLEAGVRMLAYSGQFDLICNSLGTARYLSALEWAGATAYRASPRRVWRDPSGATLRGWNQTGGGMSHIVVAGAGHMAPADQPEACYQMMRGFIASS